MRKRKFAATQRRGRCTRKRNVRSKRIDSCDCLRVEIAAACAAVCAAAYSAAVCAAAYSAAAWLLPVRFALLRASALFYGSRSLRERGAATYRFVFTAVTSPFAACCRPPAAVRLLPSACCCQPPRANRLVFKSL